MQRQQPIVASRKVKQVRLRPHERGLLVLLSSIARRWREAVLLVNPDTTVHWHREGQRLLWSRKSKPSTIRMIPSCTEPIGAETPTGRR